MTCGGTGAGRGVRHPLECIDVCVDCERLLRVCVLYCVTVNLFCHTHTIFPHIYTHVHTHTHNLPTHPPPPLARTRAGACAYACADVCVNRWPCVPIQRRDTSGCARTGAQARSSLPVCLSVGTICIHHVCECICVTRLDSNIGSDDVM